MLKKILLTIISLCLPMLALADELTLNKNAPKTYIVKKGDTLWDISGIFLNQPWLWPKLWRLNPEVDNPHLIYPGDELRLVFDEQGQPMLVKGKPNLKWSPQARTSLKDQNPISTLPLNVIAPFLTYDSVLTDEQIDSLPYIIGSDEGYKSSINGFKVYVNDDLTLGKNYAFYEKGPELIDPETEESLGYHAILVGTGQVMREGDMENKTPSTLYVDGAKREIRSGVYVMPVNENQMLPSYFEMKPATEDLRGSIVRSINNVREFGKFEVIIVNRGAEQGLIAGNVIQFKRKSPSIVETADGPAYTKDSSKWTRLGGDDKSDYNMPEEPLGIGIVFKTYQDVSMVLIMDTDKPLRLKDIITAP